MKGISPIQNLMVKVKRFGLMVLSSQENFLVDLRNEDNLFGK
jgi:hypothetical protein